MSLECPLKYQGFKGNNVPLAAIADGAGDPSDEAEGSAGILADSGSGDVGVPAEDAAAAADPPATATEASEGVVDVAGNLLVPGSS